MMKRLILFFIMCCFVFPIPVEAQQPTPVRIKDIGKIVEARDNQILGFGLVVGLRNTGDTRSTGFTHLALRNLLGKMGVSVGGVNFNSRNVAAVMVTATFPPFLKRGQRIAVTVSALGDSSSLVGGTLLLTPLQGADSQIYAVAQGNVVVNGVDERFGGNRLSRAQTTVGSIPDGAIIEAEVPVTFTDQHNITVVMNDSNFITVSRATEAIQDAGFKGAKAIDANTIKVPLSDLDSSDLVSTIAQLEDVKLVPDSSAKIVLNSRTGTVVIGEMVRLFPVALTHGTVSIRINEAAGGGFQQGPQAPAIELEESNNRLIYLNPASTLSSLVNALNDIGATPKDLIAIIQALKESGALVAELEII